MWIYHLFPSENVEFLCHFSEEKKLNRWHKKSHEYLSSLRKSTSTSFLSRVTAKEKDCQRAINCFLLQFEGDKFMWKICWSKGGVEDIFQIKYPQKVKSLRSKITTRGTHKLNAARNVGKRDEICKWTSVCMKAKKLLAKVTITWSIVSSINDQKMHKP